MGKKTIMSHDSSAKIYKGADTEFPLLALPPELKSRVFSFLGPKDRLNARVCKELNAIEAKSKYYVEKLNIITCCRNRNHYDDFCKTLKNTICLLEDQSHSIDGIRRITQNASIGTLSICFGGSEELDGALYDLLNDFKVDKLVLNVQNSPTVKLLMMNSFIDDIPSSCKSLEIHKPYRISAEALHEVYEAMMKGTTNLREFSSKAVHYRSFLSSIGISIKDGVIHSRRDIEAYMIEIKVFNTLVMGVDWHIFDGNLEMVFRVLGHFRCKYIGFILHETRESLEEAKGKLVDHKVDVIRVPQ